MELKPRTYAGTTDPQMSEREKNSRAVARKAAAQSIVLLKNDGILPLAAGSPVVLLGSGASHTVKGGTGSGDVNERETVSVFAGMKHAGYQVLNEAWLEQYEADYKAQRLAWKQAVLDKAGAAPHQPWTMFMAYVGTPFVMPEERPLTETELAAMRHATAIYVLSRNAGEGADRKETAGDYYLTAAEKKQLQTASEHFAGLVLVLNCGGAVDIGFTQEIKVNAVVHLSQPGMEGGNALADVLSGAVTPCGKMTDTWAFSYSDYPNAATFSHNNGDVETELYTEGIYVGYRYFDTFGVKPCIPFGFGLSYTQFAVQTQEVSLTRQPGTQPEVCVRVAVTNTGKQYSGKEVVQVYAQCPQGTLAKEAQRLCAFGKTPLLQPGESCTLTISFPITHLTSFSQEDSAYLLEAGHYYIAVGVSSADNTVVGAIRLEETVAVTRVQHVCPLQQPLQELTPPPRAQAVYEKISVCELRAADVQTTVVAYEQETPEPQPGAVGDLVETLSTEQLLALTNGDPGKGQDASSTIGTAGLSVPGAAGETSGCAAQEPWNIASIVLADGPAGLRLAQHYAVRESGEILRPGFVDMVEQGIFAPELDKTGCTEYYQYCTAFPVGTMLAQSWDPALLYKVGQAVAQEMAAFGVTLWLAPGMNIHRNPLCGRNFEYYSEDPLLTGVIACALTNGVQSGSGVGTTIKHLACNNQEDNRKGSNSVVSERALREIYLRGFEIAVKHAQPMAIMTSYNLLNGIHTANSHDLITKVARDEWGFAGVVMTDWVTTGEGGSSAVACINAGNDLIMPGCLEDIEALRNALDGVGAETLACKEVKKCVAHLVNIILQSGEYEGCTSYTKRFPDLRPCFRVE